MQAIIEGTEPKEGSVPRTVKAVVQTTVRVEPAVYEEAQRRAEAAGLSLNAWIVRAIQEQAKRERPDDA